VVVVVVGSRGEREEGKTRGGPMQWASAMERRMIRWEGIVGTSSSSRMSLWGPGVLRLDLITAASREGASTATTVTEEEQAGRRR